ncbi:MAG TPA: hypothetical protein VD906_08610 [Caulobacteraceae bacterium]|nr:hypothetical protein [Caulobacteraceae bacterium]
MAEYEREVRTTTPEGDPAYVRTRTATDEADRVTYVRRGSGATPWLIAAIVAVAAIIAIAFLMRDNDEPTADELAAAVDAGRAAGYVEGAATAVGDMPATVTQTIPVPVPVPTDSGASVYAERSAAEAAEAAADAREAAERAADAADPDVNVSTNTTP